MRPYIMLITWLLAASLLTPSVLALAGDAVEEAFSLAGETAGNVDAMGELEAEGLRMNVHDAPEASGPVQSIVDIHSNPLFSLFQFSGDEVYSIIGTSMPLSSTDMAKAQKQLLEGSAVAGLDLESVSGGFESIPLIAVPEFALYAMSMSLFIAWVANRRCGPRR